MGGHSAERVQIRLIDRTFDQQPRPVHTALAIGRNPARKPALGGVLQTGVGEDHHRRFTAQFQPDRLETICRRGEDFLRRRARTDEFDLADAGMRNHCRANVRAAGDKVDHARRKARLPDQFDQPHHRIGREVWRFDDDAIARRERRGEHHGRSENRPVPRYDHADHAERFVLHIIVRGPAPG